MDISKSDLTLVTQKHAKPSTTVHENSHFLMVDLLQIRGMWTGSRQGTLRNHVNVLWKITRDIFKHSIPSSCHNLRNKMKITNFGVNLYISKAGRMKVVVTTNPSFVFVSYNSNKYIQIAIAIKMWDFTNTDFLGIYLYNFCNVLLNNCHWKLNKIWWILKEAFRMLK